MTGSKRTAELPAAPLEELARTIFSGLPKNACATELERHELMVMAREIADTLTRRYPMLVAAIGAAKLRDVREAVRVSHVLLDSHSPNAGRIEELLRSAIEQIDALQGHPVETGLSKAEVLGRLDVASKLSANKVEVARDMATDALLDYINDADIGSAFGKLMRAQLGHATE